MADIILVLFLASAAFLLYVRAEGVDSVSPNLCKFAIPAAKYIAATFMGTYGSLAGGAVIAAPLFLYSRLTHSQSGADLVSPLLDRPYFPFQMGVAFVLGYLLGERLKEAGRSMSDNACYQQNSYCSTRFFTKCEIVTAKTRSWFTVNYTFDRVSQPQRGLFQLSDTETESATQTEKSYENSTELISSAKQKLSFLVKFWNTRNAVLAGEPLYNTSHQFWDTLCQSKRAGCCPQIGNQHLRVARKPRGSGTMLPPPQIVVFEVSVHVHSLRFAKGAAHLY